MAQGSNWLWQSSPKSRVFTLKVKHSSIHLLLHSQKACTWTHEGFNWALAGLEEVGLFMCWSVIAWDVNFQSETTGKEWSQHLCLSFLICKMGLAVGCCEKGWGWSMQRAGLNREPRGHDYGGAAVSLHTLHLPPRPWASPSRGAHRPSRLPFPLISSQPTALYLPSQAPKVMMVPLIGLFIELFF